MVIRKLLLAAAALLVVPTTPAVAADQWNPPANLVRPIDEV